MISAAAFSHFASRGSTGSRRSANSRRSASSRHSARSRRDAKSRRLAVASLLTTSALLLAACGEEGSASDETSNSAGASAGSAGERRGEAPATEQAVGLPLDPPRIQVLSTGTGERKLLSYNDVNSEQAVDIEVSEGFQQLVMKNDQLVTEAPELGDLVTTTLPVAGSVLVPEGFTDSTPGAGSARHVDFRVRDPHISGTKTSTSSADDAGLNAAGLAEEIASADGFGFGWLAENNGQLNTLLLAAPQQASDQARAVVEQSLTKLVSTPVIFPDEPVGIGAQWSVDSRVTGEATMLQTTTFTVTDISGDEVKLDISVEQRPALGALSLEGHAGAEGFADDTLNVTSTNTRSRGSLTVDMKQPLPVAGELDFTTRVVYGNGDGAASVVQDSSTRMRFSSAQ
ncbi:hypothetical protein [Corynebacterium pseudodiphtheriticum]|uniref:hypothetical protein n=1 Tax=Corynebacterium pseudodiphtheriticum TaxID=37637 RepID=UPI0025422103|nr:hypothetical protein [Corynebacterium pseudodiphtheriticum]MDK4273070.1 hypothetical protein [Corynebacterium pseudodiphtheriticum]